MHILPHDPGAAFPELTGLPDRFREVSAPELRECLGVAYERITEASRSGRVSLDAEQTALCLEIANASFRRGLEVGSGSDAFAEVKVNVVPFSALVGA